MTSRDWLLAILLCTGCGASTTPDDGGRLDGAAADATSGDCTGAADGTACGAGSICVGGACVAGRCGDGVVDARSEQCDDANATAFDGCEPTCMFTCSADASCDDLIACNGSETCDTVSTHRCVGGSPLLDGAECTLAAGGTGSCRDGTCVIPGCGNGVVEGDEHCDDGNTTARDGCETDCRFTCEVETTMTNTWHLDCDGDGYAAAGAPTQTTALAAPTRACRRRSTATRTSTASAILITA